MSSAGSGLDELAAELALVDADMAGLTVEVLRQGFANKILKLWQSHVGEKLVLFAKKTKQNVASLPLSSEFQLPGRVAMETPKRFPWTLTSVSFVL